jgi:hypothetical protein
MIVNTLKHATLQILEGNIMVVTVADDVEINEQDVHEVYARRKELIGDREYAVVIISGLHATITPEARKLSAHPAYVKNRKAFAMVVTSLAQRIVGNFYIRFDKPVSPSRVFTDTKKALEWVKSFDGIGTENKVAKV